MTFVALSPRMQALLGFSTINAIHPSRLWYNKDFIYIYLYCSIVYPFAHDSQTEQEREIREGNFDVCKSDMDTSNSEESDDGSDSADDDVGSSAECEDNAMSESSFEPEDTVKV